jgi:enoyl-CoA hydratase/carnithine racemase
MSVPELVGTKSEEDGVELLTLRHPPVNALSTGVLDQLDARLSTIASDGKTRCVVLTGDGQYFSAGADIKEMAVLGKDKAPEIEARGQALFQRLADLRCPTIAAVNGLAVGGGLELALACDLRVSADSAKFGAPEVSLGLLPAYGGTQRLPRLVGPAKAKELIFTAALIPGPEALRIGLVNKVVPAGQELRAARDWAHAIGQKAPRAIAGAKEAIRVGLDGTVTDGLRAEREAFMRDVMSGTDLDEGLAAFIEHRPPKFTGA